MSVLTGVVEPEVAAEAQVALAGVHVQPRVVQRARVPVPRRARAQRAHALPALALCTTNVDIHFMAAEQSITIIVKAVV